MSKITNPHDSFKDSFVDKEFRHHFSDLLYTVKHQQTDLHLYLLFEHKSSPDHWIALQLLRYMVRIWEQYTPDFQYLLHDFSLLSEEQIRGEALALIPISQTNYLKLSTWPRISVPDKLRWKSWKYSIIPLWRTIS